MSDTPPTASSVQGLIDELIRRSTASAIARREVDDRLAALNACAETGQDPRAAMTALASAVIASLAPSQQATAHDLVMTYDGATVEAEIVLDDAGDVHVTGPYTVVDVNGDNTVRCVLCGPVSPNDGVHGLADDWQVL